MEIASSWAFVALSIHTLENTFEPRFFIFFLREFLEPLLLGHHATWACMSRLKVISMAVPLDDIVFAFVCHCYQLALVILHRNSCLKLFRFINSTEPAKGGIWSEQQLTIISFFFSNFIDLWLIIHAVFTVHNFTYFATQTLFIIVHLSKAVVTFGFRFPIFFWHNYKWMAKLTFAIWPYLLLSFAIGLLVLIGIIPDHFELRIKAFPNNGTVFLWNHLVLRAIVSFVCKPICKLYVFVVLLELVTLFEDFELSVFNCEWFWYLWRSIALIFSRNDNLYIIQGQLMASSSAGSSSDGVFITFLGHLHDFVTCLVTFVFLWVSSIISTKYILLMD